MKLVARRLAIAAAAVACAATAFSLSVAGGQPSAPSAGAGPSCADAGAPARLSLGSGGAARSVAVGGQRGDRALLVAAEYDPAARPAELLGAVAATPGGSTVVSVVDAKGPDRLLLSTGAGGSWRQVFSGPDVRYPAVSAAGDRIAFTAAGRLMVAAAAGGWEPSAVAPPAAGKHVAEYVRFVDDRRLLLTVEVAVPGVSDDHAALSDVWTVDLGSGRWTRLTTGVADADRWSIARTPTMAADGSLLYVRATGLASGSDADLRTELRRVSPSGTDSAVGSMPDRWGIVTVGADGSVVGSMPDQRSQWRLELRDARGGSTALGCGRASWAPPLNHDPDYTP